MVQSLVVHRPVALDEPVQVNGEILAVRDVPRGQTVDTDVWFEDASGNRVLSARRMSLRPDPRKAGARGAGERPSPVVSDVDALTTVAEHTLTPDAVTGYSVQGNSIHYDMAAANRAGFRAPMIGGGMGVHFLMAALWASYRPSAFDLDIYFRRPIFWDDTFAVALAPDASAVCLWREQAGVKKVLTEARINTLG